MTVKLLSAESFIMFILELLANTWIKTISTIYSTASNRKFFFQRLDYFITMTCCLNIY